jgi:glutamate synthase (NADPH/NADH) large chain
VLAAWDALQAKFVKVMPRDYRRVLAAQAQAKAEGREPTWNELLGVTNG